MCLRFYSIKHILHGWFPYLAQVWYVHRTCKVNCSVKYREMVLICSFGKEIESGRWKREREREMKRERERERKTENNRYVGWELPLADLTRPTPFASKQIFFLHMFGWWRERDFFLIFFLSSFSKSKIQTSSAYEEGKDGENDTWWKRVM